MNRKFQLSWRISTVCIVLALAMLRMSYWQWQRHLEKQKYIQKLEEHLNLPVLPIEQVLVQALKDPLDLVHCRVLVTGTYDFDYEFTIKNRRYKGNPGMLVITPLKLSNSPKRILVSRGFIPLAQSKKEIRKKFDKKVEVSFVGLIKNDNKRRMFAPEDPNTGPALPWVDSFLRIDINHIKKQLPYDLAPFYLEVMKAGELKEVEGQIVKEESDKAEIFMLPLRALKQEENSKGISQDFPIAMFSTVVPPGRHLGYVFEWGIMALMTLLIGTVLQLKRAGLKP